MRRFTSYGPVNERKHFILPRSELVNACADHLIDDPEEGGHFFTIWAPRQTGKTWLARRAKGAIESRHPDRYSVGLVSVQGVVMKPGEPEEAFLDRLPLLFWETFRIEMDSPPKSFEEFKNLFLREKGLFRRPLILFIDEFDSADTPTSTASSTWKPSRIPGEPKRKSADSPIPSSSIGSTTPLRWS